MSISESTERVIRSRRTRLVLAILLIGIAAWAFFPYMTSRVASSAYVNAELMRVTAPIAGRLASGLPRQGEFIAKAEPVDLIKALSPDRRQLLDYRTQLSGAKQRADLARKQLDEIAASDTTLQARAESFKSGVVNRITREIDEASAEHSGCLLEARQRDDVGTRMQELVKLGSSSQIRAAEAAASREATMTRCGIAEARIKRLSVELEAAKKGTFLRDGTNDVPYSQQQRDRLFIRRQELEAQLTDEQAKINRLTAAIAEEERRLARVDNFEMTLPANFVVWSLTASPGSTVVEGQSLFDLADCRQRFLVVELPEREFERVHAGDAASVRLIGGDSWTKGVVRQVRGSAARADDRLLAAQIAKPSSGTFSVEVEIPNEALLGGHAGYCDIGRLAEVRFARVAWSMPGVVAGWWKWLRGPERTASIQQSAGQQ
jgi:multidrug resistance efflux pump